MFRNNYVVFFNNADFYRIPYQDLTKYPGVKTFFGFQPDNVLLANLFHAHTSKKVNSVVRLPLKSLWMNRFRNFDFSNNKPMCFLFMANYLPYEYVRSFVKSLHSEYPQAKFVCYYSDIITDEAILPSNLSSLFDVFISYDVVEARKYDIHYHPTSFSNVIIENNDSIESCDVYFLACPKDRLKKIYKIYDQLCDAAIKCDFYLVGVNPKQQRAGINYINKKMTYCENLQHVVHSHCLLEIEQGGASGPTLRTWEAINFGRGLITDNYHLTQTEFYNSDYVSIVAKDNLVDIGFVKNFSVGINPVREMIRPNKLLEFIDILI